MSCWSSPRVTIFLSTLSLRRATARIINPTYGQEVFLSTLSLRRATIYPSLAGTTGLNFYPRSPCGERHVYKEANFPGFAISIHALLAESDLSPPCCTDTTSTFLSTLSLRRATHTNTYYAILMCISIHALLAESDPLSFASCFTALLFLSTLSLRRATSALYWFSIADRYFYPRSPCGERPSENVRSSP